MTMDAKTETALRDSIAKWQANARAETPNDVKMGPGNCPLCRMYHPDFGGQEDCEGCPISARTGGPYCQGAPYGDACNAFFDWRFRGHNHTAKHKAAAHTAARSMADFLTSLLPEGKQ